MKGKEKNLGFLGFNFQLTLIKSIIEEKKYGESIIHILETKFFDNPSFRFIIENIKELHKDYNKIPSYETIAQKIRSECGESFDSNIHLDTLERIKESSDDLKFVMDTGLNFCRQQNLLKVIRESILPIIDDGDFEEYHRIETIVNKALSVGVVQNEEVNIFDEVDEALESDYRHPIPTGIVGIDNALSGGLGRKELGVILAGTGVGKSTILTKIANTAYNHGHHVLHIFFEDTKIAIERKHFTIWTGVESKQQSEVKEQIKEVIENVKLLSKGSLRLLKYPSEGTTVADIRSKIRRLVSDGVPIDLLVVDYVDCINGSKTANGEEWKGEASIMRSLETMAEEFNLACWVGTQGGRSSSDTEIVMTAQMGGSIKKAQIAHVIISIGKTLEQKENNLATMTILKSRIGGDGIVFQNCKFNNSLLLIDTESQNTLLGQEQIVEQERADRVNAARLRARELNNNLN